MAGRGSLVKGKHSITFSVSLSDHIGVSQLALTRSNGFSGHLDEPSVVLGVVQIYRPLTVCFFVKYRFHFSCRCGDVVVFVSTLLGLFV